MRDKAAEERQVFRKFAVTAGLLQIGSDFDSRIPPEPDILLTHLSGMGLAFELVEILDRPYFAAHKGAFETMRLCGTAVNQLPEPLRQAFCKEFANAHISLSFCDALSMQMRSNSLPKILWHLLALPPGSEGEQDIPPLLSRFLTRICIARIDINGPLFATSAGTWVGDPTLEEIKRKLAKKYETSAPLNLLAYIGGNPMFPESVWMPKLDQFLSSLNGVSQFEHIYVFDTIKQAVKFHWQRAP
jgi:hypothetical protein